MKTKTKSKLTETFFAYLKPVNSNYVRANWFRHGHTSKSQFIDSLIDKYRKEHNASNAKKSQ